MGSVIKINDTLKISKERGFPRDLNLLEHTSNPHSSTRFLGKEFEFWNPDERLYHTKKTRVFLVEEIDKKWLYWGNAVVISQTIEDGKTKGRYRITKLYYPDFQRRITVEESKEGESYFPDQRTSLVVN